VMGFCVNRPWPHVCVAMAECRYQGQTREIRGHVRCSSVCADVILTSLHSGLNLMLAGHGHCRLSFISCIGFDRILKCLLIFNYNDRFVLKVSLSSLLIGRTQQRLSVGRLNRFPSVNNSPLPQRGPRLHALMALSDVSSLLEL
jgi:hypothetical protein